MKEYIKTLNIVYKLMPIISTIYLVLNISFRLLPNVEIILIEKVIEYLSDSNLKNSLWIVYIIFLMMIIQGIKTPILNALKLKMQYNLSIKLYHELYKVVYNTKLTNLDNAEYMQKINEGKSAIDEKILEAFSLITDFLGIITSILMLVITLYKINILYIYFFCTMSIMQNIFVFVHSKDSITFIKYQNQKEREHTYYNEIIKQRENIKEIRSYNIAFWLEKKREQVYEEIKNKNLAISKKWTKINILWAMLMFIMEAVLYLMLYKQLTMHEIQISQVILLIQNCFLFVGNCSITIDLVITIKQENIFIFSLLELLNDTNDNKVNNYYIEKSNEKLFNVKNITFRYNTKKVIENISFTMKKKEVIALVGENGSGKSTLVKLLTNLLSSDEGTIHIYTKQIGVVFQDYSIFKLTLRENIGLGNLDEIDNDTKIKNIFNQVGLEHLKNLKHGFDTQIGKEFSDKAIDLSGGERQKVAIARGIFQDADLLILDEPTASLDAFSEKEQMENIKKICEGKSLIIISHRIGLLNLADRILFLDKGNIIEQGKHDELMNLNGRYANFYNSQAKWYN